MRRQCRLPVTPTISAPAAPASRGVGERPCARPSRNGHAVRSGPAAHMFHRRDCLPALRKPRPRGRGAHRALLLRGLRGRVRPARTSEGLTRYYALAGGQRRPGARRSPARAEPRLARAAARRARRRARSGCARSSSTCRALHCAALRVADERAVPPPGAAAPRVTVNPALGKVRLRVAARRFDVRACSRASSASATSSGPPQARGPRRRRDLPVRLGRVRRAHDERDDLLGRASTWGSRPAEGDAVPRSSPGSRWRSRAARGG